MALIQQVLCRDDYPISLTLYESDQAKGIVIIAAALGVPQPFYRRYAEFLCGQGYDVITFNYRGTGDSVYPDKKVEVKLEDWGHQDIEAIIQFALERQSNNTSLASIHYVGHSIGGQLLGLAESSSKLDNMIFVASSAPYWQRWSFPKNLKMWIVGQLLIPGLSIGKKDFPAKKVGLGSINFPSSAARQWAQWMGRPAYLFCEKFDLDIQHYAALTQPLLSYGFTDDELAPEINVTSLLNYFPNANSEVRMVAPKMIGQKSIGHSGYFRDKVKETLWQDALKWFSQS